MKKFIVSLVLFVAAFGLFVAYPSLAQTEGCPPGQVCKLNNPLGDSIDTPQKLIGKVINSVLGVVGSLALLMFVYGGLTWMTSSGNAEKVKKGRDIIIWSAIGLAIIFSAYGLTRVLIEGVTQ